MTTGTKYFDARTYQPTLYGAWLGCASKKVWSGGDSPPRPPKRYEVLIPSYESHLINPRTNKPFVIPEYRKRVDDPHVVRQRGENNYSATHEVSNGAIYLYMGASYGFGNVVTPPNNNPSAEVPAVAGQNWGNNDDIALMNRLRKKMVGSEFNPAAFLSTSFQSLDMVALTALRISRSLALMQKGRIREAARALVQGTGTKLRRHNDLKTTKMTQKDLASAQLELSYGWLPLLGDAYAGAQYIAHNTQLPMRTSYRARFQRAFWQTPASTPVWSFPRQKCYVRGQIIARVSEDFAFSTSYLSGLDDPLSMAWERLPWSFVADWFMPIQNYLLARQFARQVTGTFVYTTGWYKLIEDLKGSGGYVYYPSKTYNSAFFYEGKSITRTILTTLDVKLPKPVSLSSVPSWRRCLNAVSLLATRNTALSDIAGYGVMPLAGKVAYDELRDEFSN